MKWDFAVFLLPKKNRNERVSACYSTPEKRSVIFKLPNFYRDFRLRSRDCHERSSPKSQPHIERSLVSQPLVESERGKKGFLSAVLDEEKGFLTQFIFLATERWEIRVKFNIKQNFISKVLKDNFILMGDEQRVELKRNDRIPYLYFDSRHPKSFICKVLIDSEICFLSGRVRGVVFYLSSALMCWNSTTSKISFLRLW